MNIRNIIIFILVYIETALIFGILLDIKNAFNNKSFRKILLFILGISLSSTICLIIFKISPIDILYYNISIIIFTMYLLLGISM